MPGIKVLASSLTSDADQLLIQKKNGGYLAVAFTNSGTAQKVDEIDNHTFAEVPADKKSALIDQCLGDAQSVNLEALNQ